jgi:hypothetical protein
MNYGWHLAVASIGACGLLTGCAATRGQPVGHWPMTDPPGSTVLADTSGHGRTATLEGDVRPGSGAYGNAVSFSGERAGLASFAAPPLTAVSLAAWVKVAGLGLGDKPYPRVVEWPGGFLHVVSQDDVERLGLTFNVGAGHWTSAGGSFATGEWAHVALTYDGSAAINVPIFYINGLRVPYVLGKQPSGPVAMRGGSGTLGNDGAHNRPFQGLLSDMRMYDVVLAPRQVAALARRTPDGLAPRDVAATYRDELPVLDISGETRRHVVIAAGTKEVYQGHATTLLMPDQRTMFAVWCLEHGGACGPLARSDDAGLTWTRLDETLPAGFSKHRNCPSLYRIVDGQGQARLWIFSSSRGMERLLSADDGRTWVEMPPLGFQCGMPFTGMVRLKDGRTAAFGQMRAAGKDQGAVMCVTADGGLTWSAPRLIAQQADKDLCEPFVLRSPDGQELACLLRENRHTAKSMMCFSRDEGETWSAPEDTPWGLTGDRHLGVQTADGRWLIAFRDRALGSSTYGQFVAWVGTYDDIRQARPGQFRIKLLHHYGSPRDGYAWAYADTGYPGLELLPDDTIVATTYTKYWDDERRHSVVSTRFKLKELHAQPR